MSRRDYESPKSLGLCEVGVEAVEKRIKALSDDFMEKLECLDISQNGFEAILLWLLYQSRLPMIMYIEEGEFSIISLIFALLNSFERGSFKLKINIWNLNILI